MLTSPRQEAFDGKRPLDLDTDRKTVDQQEHGGAQEARQGDVPRAVAARQMAGGDGLREKHGRRGQQRE